MELIMTTSINFPSAQTTTTILAYTAVVGTVSAVTKIGFHRLWSGKPEESLSNNFSSAGKSIFYGGLTGGIGTVACSVVLSGTARALGHKETAEFLIKESPTLALIITGCGLVAGGILFAAK